MEKVIATVVGALIGSFSAASLSYIYHERKEKQLLIINCRLLLDEVIKHATWLDKDRLVDGVNIVKFANNIDLDLRNDLKHNLLGIKFEQFDVLRQHFKNMKELKTTVDNFNSQKSLYPIPDELFIPYKETCEKAATALFKICHIHKEHS
ncbi:MAG: hypothetical protein H6Q71_678 [Firmicutes bacterium]|nr:hypothetical protein [Bacillota bacterium]